MGNINIFIMLRISRRKEWSFVWKCFLVDKAVSVFPLSKTIFIAKSLLVELKGFSVKESSFIVELTTHLEVNNRSTSRAMLFWPYGVTS